MIILSHDLFIIPFTLPFLCYEMELGMETSAEGVFRIDTAPAAVTHFSISHPRIHIFPWTVTYLKTTTSLPCFTLLLGLPIVYTQSKT